MDRRYRGVIAAIIATTLPALADARDGAPTLSIDAATHATLVSGPHHLHKAALNLNVVDWWLAGTVHDGGTTQPQVIVDAHMPDWALLDHATDTAGDTLTVTVLERRASPLFARKVRERVAIALPPAVADKARHAGLAITLAGAKRAFPIDVPAQAVAAFLDGYAAVTAPAADRREASAPPLPAPTATTSTEKPQAMRPAAVPTAQIRSAHPSPAPVRRPIPPGIPSLPTPPLASLPGAATFHASTDADAAADAPDAGGGGTGTWVDSVGLQIVATSSGAMVLATRPGSIAESKGIGSGDFVEAVDGVVISKLPVAAMARAIGGRSVHVLHMLAAGDVRLR